jgi:hypothetical protein
MLKGRREGQETATTTKTWACGVIAGRGTRRKGVTLGETHPPIGNLGEMKWQVTCFYWRAAPGASAPVPDRLWVSGRTTRGLYIMKLYIYSIRAQIIINKHLNQITQPLFTCIPIYIIAKPVNFTLLTNQLSFTLNPSQYIYRFGVD